MNVADLDYCKELYELSGWEPDSWFELDEESGEVEEYLLTYEDVVTGQGGGILKNTLPAYDLGYLIRKLPATRVKLVNKQNIETGNRFWLAQYHRNNVPKRMFTTQTSNTIKKRDEVVFSEDTPENALCKLAIELHKQGVLPPKQEQGE